jgi:poly(glycerol-phosphate) alpha-glucosyltransferase
VVRALAGTMTQQGVKAEVFGLDDPWVKEDFANNAFPLMTGKVLGPATLGFSPDLKRQLQRHLTPRAVIHSHGLWMHPGISARKCAVRNRSPLVVSPHGMLEPWALQNSRWKKQLAGWLFENKNLRTANCLHALCAAEAENFRRYGLKNPIAIIPNGVDMPEVRGQRSEVRGPSTDHHLPSSDKKVLLFLSRLHPKKGLLNLLQAWKNMAPDFKDWQLLVAGGGEPAYEQELKAFSRGLILDQSVVFLGPLYGEEKKQILALADVFVLPSFSEGFSMAILEAAAAGLPVLLTGECNFPELSKANAAVEISPDSAGIESSLRQVLGLPEAQRNEMGRRGQVLVKQGYTWPLIARQMCQVYEWLLGSGPKPACVV